MHLTRMLPIFFFAAVVQAQDGAAVSIRGYRFDPAELHVKAGSTVVWSNRESRTSHSVLFVGPPGLESERIFPGESWERRFDKPGRHPYSCGPHPEMHGLIVVDE